MFTRLLRNLFIAFTCLITLLSASLCNAQVKSGNDESFSRYADKERGWFYREPIPDDEAPAPPPPPLPASAPKPPAAEPEKPAGPAPYSVAWIRKNMVDFRERAMDDPSPENVKAFLYLNKLTMDTGQRFATAAIRATLADPELDPETFRPTWSQAMTEAENAATAGRRPALTAIAKQYGIWFFFRSDCKYCHMQAPMLKFMQQRYGFSVLPISLDGKPLAGSPFPNFVTNAGQAEQLGVDRTPSIILVRPPDKAYWISQAVITVSDLERRILELGAQNGALTDEQYQATRSSKDKLLPSPVDLQKPNAPLDSADPRQVTQYLRTFLKTPSH